MTAPRTAFIALGVVSIVIAALCALRARATWVEYYGDGPPYYGRTVNMDKWESPIAELAVSGGAGIACLTATLYALVRLRGRRPL